MNEIVVISGKGGTGKTSITASLAMLGGKNAIIADCDVDAADMHLLMQPDFSEENDFYSGEIAQIDQDACTQCGKCVEICRFDAISVIDDKYVVDTLDCEGCGYCPRICSTDAITMHEQNVGKWYRSQIKTGSTMVHARLESGAENSGKLVAKVKNIAKELGNKTGKDIIIVDGAPGIGCPVVSSLSGADFAIVVTEPTVSGLHDLKRVYELIKKFRIKAGCIINKSDLNDYLTDKIEEFLKQENIISLAHIPYNESFTKAMTVGQTIVEYNQNEIQGTLTQMWDRIKQILKTKDK